MCQVYSAALLYIYVNSVANCDKPDLIEAKWDKVQREWKSGSLRCAFLRKQTVDSHFTILLYCKCSLRTSVAEISSGFFLFAVLSCHLCYLLRSGINGTWNILEQTFLQCPLFQTNIFLTSSMFVLPSIHIFVRNTKYVHLYVVWSVSPVIFSRHSSIS